MASTRHRDNLNEIILSQYTRKEVKVYTAMLQAYGEELDLIEDELAQIPGLLDLEGFDPTDPNRNPQTLDLIGALFNVPRNGRDDSDYKKALKFEILLSQATPDMRSVVSLTKQYFEVTKVEGINLGYATLQLTVYGFSKAITPTQTDLDFINKLVAPGVQIQLIICTTVNPGPYFGFTKDDGTYDSDHTTFGEEGTPDTGGVLMEEYLV